ncbi:hypothetical protein [Streptomyces sp. NPDC020298]|uniref:hypothetical protein n=1 Tax=unclassified Streptomyces TaxID=2593676 RepID=UPI0033F79D98
MTQAAEAARTVILTVVILLVSGIAGVMVGRNEGLGAGLTVAIGLTGLPHVVVRR